MTTTAPELCFLILWDALVLKVGHCWKEIMRQARWNWMVLKLTSYAFSVLCELEPLLEFSALEMRVIEVRGLLQAPERSGAGFPCLLEGSSIANLFPKMNPTWTLSGQNLTFSTFILLLI